MHKLKNIKTCIFLFFLFWYWKSYFNLRRKTDKNSLKKLLFPYIDFSHISDFFRKKSFIPEKLYCVSYRLEKKTRSCNFLNDDDYNKGKSDLSAIRSSSYKKHVISQFYLIYKCLSATRRRLKSRKYFSVSTRPAPTVWLSPSSTSFFRRRGRAIRSSPKKPMTASATSFRDLSSMAPRAARRTRSHSTKSRR